MDTEFSGWVWEHHDGLCGEGVFDSSDGLAVDVILPEGHHVALDCYEVVEGFHKLGRVGNIVSVEGHQAGEVLHFLHCC
jgi:hypothetical protein